MKLEPLLGGTLESGIPDTESKQWVFGFSNGCVLRVSCPWRVVVNDEIRLGWEDDGHLFGLQTPVDASERLTALLVGLRVEAANVGASGDLTLNFDQGSRLDIFNDSSGYEGWQLYGPERICIVAQGGGRVVSSSS